MPEFRYTAVSQSGTRTRGSMECLSRADLVKTLAGKGLRVVSAEAGGERQDTTLSRGKKKVPERIGTKRRVATSARKSKAVSEKDRIQFFQMFGRLLGGGLSTGDAVKAIATTGGSSGVKSLAEKVWQHLSDGSSFGASLKEAGAGLSPEMVEVIHAGEATGRLEPVTADVCRMLVDRKEIRELLLAKLSYPLFLITFALAVCGFLVFVLIPQVENILRSMRVEMSIPIRILLSLSEIIFWLGPALLAMGVGLFLFLRFQRNSEKGRIWQDRSIYQWPLLRSISMPYVSYHLCRTLGSLLLNGVDLTSSLQLVERTIGNNYVRKRFESARRAINDGLGAAQALSEEGLLDDLSSGVLSTHENIGELGSGFDDLAMDYRKLLDKNLNRWIRIFSALAMAFAFSLVALVALGMISAVFEVGRGIR